MADNPDQSAHPPDLAKPAPKTRRPARPKAALDPANAPVVADPVPRKHPVVGAAFGKDWWQRGVVYQVYPRSFADSNGDGIGDLPGLIAKLDYLNDGTERSLGIDAIWLSPIHPSPGFDVGYDVADYDAIDPIYGTLDDFDRLIAEAHRRGIRLMLDLVMNHTSSAHRWFEESRRDPNGPYGDWYLWRDGRPGRFGRKRPPEQLAIVLRRLGLDLGRGPRPVLHAHVPAGAAGSQLAQSCRPRGNADHGSWLARSGRGRLSPRRLQRLLQERRDAVEPAPPAGSPALRPAGPPARQGSAGAHRVPGRVPGAARLVSRTDVGGRALRIRSPRRDAPERPGHMVFDWNLIGQPWKAQAFAAATEKHERDVRAGPLADPRHVESRSAAAGEPPGAGRGRHDERCRGARCRQLCC